MLKLEEGINYGGWDRCIRLSNSQVELIIATEIGLRILHFGFIGGKNIFHLSKEDAGKKGGNEWRIYGGHRLWHAPEAMPRTYEPDNDPVTYSFNENKVTICQQKEKNSGIVKIMDIFLSAESNQVKIIHHIVNKSPWPLNLSAWAISVLRPGGTAIVPQEPFGEGDEFLLPARSISLWSYTSMQDTRWTWGKKYILAKQDASKKTEQKIGVLNKQGWGAYVTENECFIKRFHFDSDANYPDFGSNYEIYINGSFLESETLGGFKIVQPGEELLHTEYWDLHNITSDLSEESIDRIILPFLKSSSV